MDISLFKNIYQSTGGENIGLEDFLTKVKFGFWGDVIEQVRAEPDHKKRSKLKEQKLPYVTISGTFPERRKMGEIGKHSGFICIDFDDKDNDFSAQGTLEKTRKKLEEDPYTWACLLSASGKGFAVLVKIDPEKHLDAFLGLELYYGNKYQLIVDVSCKDVTRPRFVSWDPELFQNLKAKTFKSYPKKEPKKYVDNFIISNADLEGIVRQLERGGVDLTQSSYERFLKIGYALASELGEEGRNIFHRVCAISPKYNERYCNRQYEYCLKGRRQGVSMGTFYFLAKDAGVEVVSEKTKHIVTVAKLAKKGGRTAEDCVFTLQTLDQLPPEETEAVVKQVFEKNIDLRQDNELSIDEQLELMLRTEYNIKRNELTRVLEDGGRELEPVDINSIWLQARRKVSDKLSFELLERTLNSNFIESYNPLKEWIDANRSRKPERCIFNICESIDSDTPFTGGNFNPLYVEKFFTKWAVGMIAGIYGETSPLLLVLTGEKQNTGKTEFFRRLLPPDLFRFYAESKLDAGKDDWILMTQKLLIMDDEFGGKSKQENKLLKEITSKHYFTLREPYGRKNVTLRRLAALAGTSNDNGLISDPTGNRRIIPIHVTKINHELYNSVNKADLFIELVDLYESGFDWRLSKEDIEELNAHSGEFEQTRPEYELINRFFRVPEEGDPDSSVVEMTATDIKDYIENETVQKLSTWKMGAELTSIGFEKKIKKINGKAAQVYRMARRSFI